MRPILSIAAIAVAGIATASGQIHFTASLSGLQEVPPVVTTAMGTGSFALSDDFTRLSWTVSYQGLSGPLTAGGHFHVGRVGVNGPVVKNIASGGDPAANTVSGVWTRTDASQPLTTALVDSLLAGRLYINFHTGANPGGEIRGQVNLMTGIHFTAHLDGSQQNPPVSTTADGTGSFTLNATRTELRWDVTYRGLSGTLTAGGHFHVADSGRNGPVVKNIASSGDPASNTLSGVWTTSDVSQPLTVALVDSLIAGKLYVNFHTGANPAGEVRGQLRRKAGIGFTSRLNGAQENPPVTTTATGTGSFVLGDDRTDLEYDVTYINLSGPLTAGGHFHMADSGRNGPIVRHIGVGGDPASATVRGVWRSSDSFPLTPALAESLMSGRIYVNFHTAANPGGEIRGQLLLSTGIGFTARLNGQQEVPPVTTNSTGTGSVVLSSTRTAIGYDITYLNLSGTLTAGGHFHTGAAGVNGPVVKNIASGGDPASATIGGNWTTSDATQPLTKALVDSLIAARTYMNFHTGANPGGEIRGQVRLAGDLLTSVRNENGEVPIRFRLEQNYPNPFNPTTTIRFFLPPQNLRGDGSNITLKVYDLLGREVATLVNEKLSPGSYMVEWDAADASSGVYFYRLQSTDFVESRKLLLLR